MCTVLRREYIFLYSREEMYMYKRSPCTLCTTISLHSLSFCTQTSWKASDFVRFHVLMPCSMFYVTVQVLERRNFFWKKCFQLLCADKIFITLCWNILKWIECFLTFGDFAVPKFFLHDKIIDKTQTQKKNQTTNKQTKFRTLFWRYLSNKSSLKFLHDMLNLKELEPLT